MPKRRERSRLVAPLSARVALLVLPATARSSLGQGVARVGSEFQVNTYTTNGQRAPAVAVAPGGSLFVVWDSAGSPLGDSEAIGGRFFDSDGLAGDDFQVNVETVGQQIGGAVAARPGGDFIVVWESGAIMQRGEVA